ncbi:2'-5' RNA ligase family protein [Streptomyces sp. NPDC058418]|uniref:2'-5' RNA ligase family protein n=1 Tax=Streptomyces sp. NPDC058418 TaxID=3346488 RepID=UPI0036616B60
MSDQPNETSREHAGRRGGTGHSNCGPTPEINRSWRTSRSPASRAAGFITVDQITDAVGAGISPAARDALVEELGKRLADVEPFDIMIGSLESYATGVIADLHPDDQLAALHRAVREAIRTVRGDDAVRYPWGLQHLTISYAREEASSDDAQRILRRVRPSHAPLHVTEVQLVDVTADSTAKTITWERLATVPLGGQ